MSSPEASARALLLDMQTKLAAGPHVALGLPAHATAADIRSAFLQLTKTFHPARFGRMTAEIQRLSNEVFLSLRAAHDLIAKPAAPATKPSGRSSTTTGSPTTKPATTRPFGVPIAPVTPPQPMVRSQGSGRVEKPEAPAHRQTQPMPMPMPGKPPTNPPGPPARPTPVPPSATARPAGPTPSQTPAARPAGPTPAQTPTRPSQPGGAIRFPAATKPTTGAPATPASKPTTGAPPATTTVATARPTGSSAQGVALDPELALILQLMGMGQWDAAQAAIDALAAKSPQNKRYAALAHYSRGRRAQLDGNLRIAQIELNDALKLDPDLDVAKSAFAELYARRK